MFVKVSQMPLQTVTEISKTQQAMVLYPDVQEAAHKELDDVVGSNRLPAWEDWLTLPYVRSCMKETLRCKNLLLLRQGEIP